MSSPESTYYHRKLPVKFCLQTVIKLFWVCECVYAITSRPNQTTHVDILIEIFLSQVLRHSSGDCENTCNFKLSLQSLSSFPIAIITILCKFKVIQIFTFLCPTCTFWLNNQLTFRTLRFGIGGEEISTGGEWCSSSRSTGFVCTV